MHYKNITLMTLCSLAFINGCTGSKSTYRAYEKQSTPANVAINRLDLANKSLQLRFEYRSYIHEAIDSIDCNMIFNDTSETIISMQQSIEIGAFSTEILPFENLQISNIENLYQQDKLRYSLQCFVKYNKGKERIYSESELHLVPSSKFQYR